MTSQVSLGVWAARSFLDKCEESLQLKDEILDIPSSYPPLDRKGIHNEQGNLKTPAQILPPADMDVAGEPGCDQHVRQRTPPFPDAHSSLKTDPILHVAYPQRSLEMFLDAAIGMRSFDLPGLHTGPHSSPDRREIILQRSIARWEPWS